MGLTVAYLEDGRESFAALSGHKDMQTCSGPVSTLRFTTCTRGLHAPLALDDVAVVHTRYVYHPGARLDFEYKVYREADGVFAGAEGSTVQLFIDVEGMVNW